VLTLPAAVPAVIGGPLGGYLVGTRGPRGVLIGGTLALAAGVGLLVVLPVHVALGWLLLAYVVVGAGYAVLNAPVSTVAVSSMPRDQAGVAAAVASSARNVGIVFGIAVLGTIVNSRVHAIVLPDSGATDAAVAAFQHAYVHALHIAYAVAATVVVGAAVVAALTMRPTPPGASA
jgi:MFS family permease